MAKASIKKATEGSKVSGRELLAAPGGTGELLPARGDSQWSRPLEENHSSFHCQP